MSACKLKVRKNGRVVSVAVIIVCAVNSDGYWEIIGMGIGESEAKAFWLAFLLSLKERGLEGVAGHLRRAQRPESGDTAGVSADR